MGEEVHYWFGRALDLPPARRFEFLEANCHDRAICSEVVSLLEYDVTREPRTLGRVVQSAVGTLLGPAGHLPAGRVGHFELGRLLGSGGMGEVYEGERVDGEVRRRVAIKFATLPPFADRETRADGHRRFLRERQMLASLGHPYIAGLIDAGAAEDGTAYAVIEKVDSMPIDSYCTASAWIRPSASAWR